MKILYLLIQKAYAALPGLPGVEPEKYEIEHIEQLLLYFIKMFFLTLIPVSAIVLIWGAYQYLTAYGNEEKAQRGKNIVLWAIIGLVIAFLAQVIIAEVWRLIYCPGRAPCELPSLIPIDLFK